MNNDDLFNLKTSLTVPWSVLGKVQAGLLISCRGARSVSFNKKYRNAAQLEDVRTERTGRRTGPVGEAECGGSGDAVSVPVSGDGRLSTQHQPPRLLLTITLLLPVPVPALDLLVPWGSVMMVRARCEGLCYYNLCLSAPAGWLE